MTAPEQSRSPRVTLRPPQTPTMVVVAVGGSIARDDIPELVTRVRALLEGSDAHTIVWDVEELATADAVVVDAVARMQLVARRLGRRGELFGAPQDLRDLIAVMGLSEVVPVCAALPVEARGKAEEREEPVGVEEEVEPGDPAP